jgi:D-alanine-D-alanine ligase
LRIGLAFDLVPAAARSWDGDGPDDRYEEFDKPETVAALADVLRGLGHEVVLLGDGRELLARVLADPPDLVWNLAEGEGVGRCREARVPAVLEMLGIACTGSDPLTLAAALDKPVAKQLVAAAGVAVPQGIVVTPDSLTELGAAAAASNLAAFAARVPFPWLLKPAYEGSSKGIRTRCLVDSQAQAQGVLRSLVSDYDQPVLVEEFIAGDEVTAGVIGTGSSATLIGTMRIVPRNRDARFVYSIEMKRQWSDNLDYEGPAALPETVLRRLERAALCAYAALGCRDVARIDFRVRDDVPVFLEANPLPGLAPGWSDLVILARGMGIDYPVLIRRILDAALTRIATTSAAPQGTAR